MKNTSKTITGLTLASAVVLSQANVSHAQESNNKDKNSEMTQKLNDKNDGVSQTFSDNIKLVSENGKLSQALSNNNNNNIDSGTNVNISAAGHSSSNSNLGLSMPGLSALLAGTPSADNPIPGASTSSSLLERLTSSTPNTTAAFSSPPLPVTPQSPNVSALSPNQNVNFQKSSFSTSPNSNTFNSTNSNSPLSNITSPASNFTSSSPKSQMQFQSSSPSSKEVMGITSPLSSPPGTTPVSLNLQGLSLQGITGLQNVQVHIYIYFFYISVDINIAK